jgi:hypothetical protein
MSNIHDSIWIVCGVVYGLVCGVIYTFFAILCIKAFLTTFRFYILLLFYYPIYERIYYYYYVLVSRKSQN